jgi:ABC-2 type transport system ATP-binding protein
VLKSRYGASKVLLEVTDGADELAAALGQAAWVSSVARGEAGEIELVVGDDTIAQREIPAMVAARGIGLRRFEAGEMGLEEVFVQLVGGESR